MQKAVNELAKAGSQLEAGDVKAASYTLNGSWASEFEAAAGKVSAVSAADVISGLSSLKTTAGKGDLKAAKAQFVELVSAVNSWASASGLAASLKGL